MSTERSIKSLLFGLAIVASARVNEPLKVRYDDYHVYRVEPEGDHQIDFLQLYEKYSRSIIFVDGVHLSGQFLNVVVAPHRMNEFEGALSTANIKYKLLETNLEGNSSKNRTTIRFDKYNRFNNGLEWFYLLERDFPNLVKVVKYGQSYESRNLVCIRISSPSSSSRRKNAIFIEAGINGQEWITSGAALYIINELLTSTDDDIYRVSRDYDWYIAPFVNPDGYEYTHNVDRLWRKTRAPHGNDYGVNMNLNWDHNWGQAGANNHTCSPNYPGEHPHSERETNYLRRYLHSLRDIRLYVALHAFGQLIQYPYTDNASSHYDALYTGMDGICLNATKAMKERYGSKYACNNHKQQPMSGTSTDYVYTKLIAPFVLNLFLRPERKFYNTGYQLPDNEIIPTAQEVLDGIVEVIASVESMLSKTPENFSGPKPETHFKPPTEKAIEMSGDTTKVTHPIHDELF